MGGFGLLLITEKHEYQMVPLALNECSKLCNCVHVRFIIVASIRYSININMVRVVGFEPTSFILSLPKRALLPS